MKYAFATTSVVALLLAGRCPSPPKAPAANSTRPRAG